MTAKQVKLSSYMNWRRGKRKAFCNIVLFHNTYFVCFIASFLHVLAFTTGCVIACYI